MTKNRLRIGILTMMGIVALAAVLLGWMEAARRDRIVLLTSDLHRQQDLAKWAEQMARRGYVSNQRLATEQSKLAEVQAQLKAMGATP